MNFGFVCVLRDGHLDSTGPSRTKQVLRVALGVAVATSLACLAATPVAAQATKKPSKLVHLTAVGASTGPSVALQQIGADGAVLGAFSVPDGQVFVMTSMNFTRAWTGGLPAAEMVRARILQGATVRLEVDVNLESGVHYVYPSGIAFGPGTALFMQFVASSGTTATRITLTGYLAPDV